MRLVDREYINTNEDFLKIRNLLIDSYKIKKSLFNWGIARWDTARYRVRAKDFARGHNTFLKKHHLWENERGELIGAIVTENNDNDVVIIIHPDYEKIETRMLEWAESNALSNNTDNKRDTIIKICVNENNVSRQQLLIERGYKKRSEAEYMRRFNLSKKNNNTLPNNFIIRNINLPQDYLNRINIHQNAFNSKDFNFEVFKMLQKAPGYETKNDFIIEIPDGQFVGFCILWIDVVNEIAEIEPFGIHTEFRNMGLGKALISYVLKSAKSKGIKYVYIGSGPEPAIANRLYDSIGFTNKQIAFWWTKNLNQ